MKKIAVSLVALSVSFTVVAQNWYPWDNPTEPFDATKSRIHKGPISIEWRLADNVSAACEKASKEFGNGGFKGANMDACAFWWGPTCVIITKKRPTMHDVGHEVRHCFYGDWH